MRIRLAALCTSVAAVVAVAPGAALASQAPEEVAGTTSVFDVGNWDGTAHVIDPQTFATVERINVVPDLEERLAEIRTRPERLAYYLAIQQFLGEGNDQYVDDMLFSHDGRFLHDDGGGHGDGGIQQPATHGDPPGVLGDGPVLPTTGGGPPLSALVLLAADVMVATTAGLRPRQCGVVDG